MSNESRGQDDLEAGRYIDVDGIRTHYHDAGEGPVVLLIHGSGPGVSAWANWRGVMPALATKFRVIAHDQLGFNGTSAGDGGRAGREAWTRHALGLMDALGIERFSVLGNSMGGAVALSMATARPKAVDRIAVMGTMGLPGPVPPGLDELWGYTPSEQNMRRAIELLAYDQSINTPELVRLRLAASMEPGADEAWQAMFPAPRQRWWDDLALSPDELGSIRQSVLMIHGLQDAVIPFRETSLRMLDFLPDVRLHVLGECGHWVQIEQTAAFLQLLMGFYGED
jgi:2-hydroxymuconate-semialdehyde hydrolase